jgi:asparagine synthase (glutamine-hydrolysing)
MCGIAGILDLRGRRPVDLAALQRMAAVQRHRGPDGWGIYRDERCGLAHDRLSIIDLATGAQPLSDAQGSLWISFNGEVFNYVELRRDLLARGHRFRTSSDTEVVVHAFMEWGEACFERFNGQWALALWDSERRRLTLCRDRLGICPLHLCEHDGRILFSSEVKAIYAADPSIPRAFDPPGLAECFTFWTPVPPRTPFASVTELRPGTLRTYGPGGDAREVEYWRPRFPLAAGDPSAFSGSLADATAALGAALAEATRLRMVRADVPVGSYLSGGLDSSLVAALAARATPKFCTFSLRFADAEYDETRWQCQMAERLGTEHREVLVTRADIAAAFPDVVYHAERPVLRTAPAPLSLLSRLVHDSGIKVVLTGEGADEMFAGYDLFREGKARRFWARDPDSRLRPLLLDRLYPYLTRSPVAHRAIARKFFGRDLYRAGELGFSHGLRWDSAVALQRLFSPALCAELTTVDVRAELLASAPGDAVRWPPLAQDQYLEIRTLLSGYLLSSQGDRVLMSHSVEGRFPFLDREVVELALSLPASFKLRRLDEKHVLKQVARDLLPSEIIARKKQPYRAPDALTFSGPDAPAWIDDLLSESAVGAAGVFDPAAVSSLWRKCRARSGEGQFSNTDNMGLVGVLSTQLLWAWLLRRPPEASPLSNGRIVDRVNPHGPRSRA